MNIALYKNNYGQFAPENFNGPRALGNILTNTLFWHKEHTTADKSNSTYLLNLSPNVNMVNKITY